MLYSNPLFILNLYQLTKPRGPKLLLGTMGTNILGTYTFGINAGPYFVKIFRIADGYGLII